jgi:hypothetical protein
MSPQGIQAGHIPTLDLLPRHDRSGRANPRDGLLRDAAPLKRRVPSFPASYLHPGWPFIQGMVNGKPRRQSEIPCHCSCPEIIQDLELVILWAISKRVCRRGAEARRSDVKERA